MFNPNKIEDLQFSTEKQIMDRKSARIRAVDLAIPIVAMANADGGFNAIGIEDNGTITGIDDYEKNLNELLRVPSFTRGGKWSMINPKALLSFFIWLGQPVQQNP